MCEGLDVMRVERKVIEVRNLRRKRQYHIFTGGYHGLYLVEVLNKVSMLVGDVLLDEGRSLEQILTRLAPELALILLLDVRLTSSRQLPVKGQHVVGTAFSIRTLRSFCRRSLEGRRRCDR